MEPNLSDNVPHEDTDSSQQIPPKPEALPDGDIDVDLSTVPIQSSVRTEPIPSKESSAREIAKYIVCFFGASLLLIITLGFVLLFWLRWAPTQADQIFNKAVIPFLEKTGTFATTVFGPLLAFILGYYFGEKNSPTATK